MKKCPECKKNKLQRLFGTGAAIVFKGSGFYQTDYRSEGYKKAAKADKKASDGGGADSKTNSSSGGSGEAKGSSSAESSKPAGGKSTGSSDSSGKGQGKGKAS